MIIESAGRTPYVHVNLSSGLVEIKGKSVREKAEHIYDPLLAMLNLHELQESLISVNFALESFDASSYDYIIEIVKVLKELVICGKDIEVNWYCPNQNEKILSLGKELELMYNVNLTFVEHKSLI